MSSYHRCSKCNSDQMMDGAFLGDAVDTKLVVGVSTHPDHGPLRRTASTLVHACVCGQCGFVEMYANKPTELWDEYRRGAATSAVR